MALQHKSAREAEQERQWKQLQALRQQQAQQQQNVIHEQRVQCNFYLTTIFKRNNNTFSSYSSSPASNFRPVAFPSRPAYS